jgi:hypothetical protein
MYRPTLGPTQPPIYLVPGLYARGLKLPGLEVDHLPYPEPKLKISGAIPLVPLYSFIAWTGKILALPITF